MNKVARFVLVFSLFAISATLSNAQRIGRWDVCEDTTQVQYVSSSGPIMAATSPTDLAVITQVLIGNQLCCSLERTSDSGRSWKEVATNVKTRDPWGTLHHPTADCFVITSTARTYLGPGPYGRYQPYLDRASLSVSKDAGGTWTETQFDTNTDINDLAMLDGDYGVAIVIHVPNIRDSLPVVMPDDLLITTDGWTTWSTIRMPIGTRGCHRVFCFRHDVFGVLLWDASAHSYHYLKTTNGGISWKTLGSLPSVADLYFVNERLGWGAGTDWSKRPQQPLIVNTTDGGLTWSTQFDTATSYGNWGEGVCAISFADSLHGFAVGSHILMTNDGGTTWSLSDPPTDLWQRQNAFPFFDNFNAVVAVTPTLAFVPSASPMLRYTGRKRLAPPIFNKHDAGPLPIEPTTISWSRLEGANHYNLQLSVDPPSAGDAQDIFNSLWLDTTVSDTFCTFTPKPAETYYARVRSLAEADSSDWRQSGDWYQIMSVFRTVNDQASVSSATIPGGITLFPNPASDEVFLTTSSAQRPTQIELIDMLGHAIAVDAKPSAAGLSFSVRSLPAGVYNVIVTGDKPRSARLVVRR